MPVMGGIDAIKEIRKVEKKSAKSMECTIIAMSTSSLPDDQKEALEAGANDFLQKPISLNLLEKKMKYWSAIQAITDFE